MPTTYSPPVKDYLPPKEPEHAYHPPEKSPMPLHYEPPTKSYLPPKTPKPTYAGPFIF